LDTDGNTNPLPLLPQILSDECQILAKEFNRSIFARDSGKHVIYISLGSFPSAPQFAFRHGILPLSFISTSSTKP
jgi:peroxiredoxin